MNRQTRAGQQWWRSRLGGRAGQQWWRASMSPQLEHNQDSCAEKTADKNGRKFANNRPKVTRPVKQEEHWKTAMSNSLRRSQQRMHQTLRQYRGRAKGKTTLGLATTFSCISLLHTTRSVYTQFYKGLVKLHQFFLYCVLIAAKTIFSITTVAPANQRYVAMRVGCAVTHCNDTKTRHKK